MYPSIEASLVKEPDVNENIDQQASSLLGYDQDYQQVEHGKFRGKFSSQKINNDFSLFYEGVNVRLNQKISVPQNRYAVCIFDASSNSQILNGETVEGGDIALLSPSSEFDVATSRDMRVIVIDIDKGLVENNLLCQTLPVFSNPNNLALISSNQGLNAALIRGIEQLVKTFRHLASDDYLSTESNRHTEITTLALAAFGDTRYVKTISKEDEPRANRFENYLHIRNYLDSEIRSEINWDNVADRFSISRRHLENLFKEFTLLSPARYVKARRLNEIRRSLMHESCLDSSIADIGAQFSMWHESRLSENYRDFFQELPSETRNNLKRSFKN